MTIVYFSDIVMQGAGCVIVFDLRDPNQRQAFADHLRAWKWSAQPVALDAEHVAVGVVPGGALRL